MIYASLDTNVLVSAIKSHKLDSSASRILNLVFDGVITPLVCEEILDEYQQVFAFPALNLDQKKVSRVLEKFREDSIYPERLVSDESFEDESDRVFYEITLSVKDGFVITKNCRHFPQDGKVVTPSEMLLILESLGII